MGTLGFIITLLGAGVFSTAALSLVDWIERPRAPRRKTA